MLHQGTRTSIILDLRGNGGGLLDQAVAVASIFIPDGTIVSTDGRTQPRQVYLATGQRDLARGSRWWCSSIAAPLPPPRSSREPCRTATEPR